MSRKKKPAPRPRAHKRERAEQPTGPPPQPISPTLPDPTPPGWSHWTTPSVLIGTIGTVIAIIVGYFTWRGTVATETSTNMVARDREAKMAFIALDSDDALIAYKLFSMKFLFKNVGQTTARDVTAAPPIIEIYSGRPDQQHCERMTEFDWVYGGPRDVPPGAGWGFEGAIELPLKSVPGIDPRVRVTLTVEYATEVIDGIEERTETVCREALRTVLGDLHWFNCRGTPLPGACAKALEEKEQGAKPEARPAPRPQ